MPEREGADPSRLELGTNGPEPIPQLVLTFNGSREIGDVLRRRCLSLLYVEPTSLEKEVQIMPLLAGVGARAS